MVVPPSFGTPSPEGIGRILLPHDGSERAGRAFSLAVDLARRIGAPVHLVTVVEDEETALPSGHGTAIDPRRRMEASADTLNQARRDLESTGANLLRQGISASWEVLTGPAAASILGACDARDLLLITSHGRTGSRWVMGSVAEKLVREAHVPVVLIRTPPEPRELPE
jgi:nucleotide-binding universal stress UspA family protein